MLTKFQTKKWMHLFSIYDTDNNGVVTKDDFEIKAKAIAQTLGFAPDSAEYKEMHSKVVADWDHLQNDVDSNGDGEISLDEWLAHGYQRISSDKMYNTVNKPEARAVFDLFDKDNNGALSRAEFITMMRQWGLSQSAAEAASTKIGLADDSAALSKERFVELLEQFHKSDDPSAPGNQFFGPF